MNEVLQFISGNWHRAYPPMDRLDALFIIGLLGAILGALIVICRRLEKLNYMLAESRSTDKPTVGANGEIPNANIQMK